MAPDDVAEGPWTELVVGAAVVHQQAIDRLEVAALILDLPSRRVRAANRAAAALIGLPVADLIGRVNSDVINFADEAAMLRAIDALVSRSIDAYRARRALTSHSGVRREVSIWCRRIELDGDVCAVYIITPVRGDPAAGSAPTTPMVSAGPLVVGIADPDWRVLQVSAEVTELLGGEPDDYLGQSLLTNLHPDDVSPLLNALRDAPVEGTVALRIRAAQAGGDWLALQCLFVRFGAGMPPSVAFALLPDERVAAGPAQDRVTELEHRLRRIVGELRAAGVMDDLDDLPSAAEFPQLNYLSSRQWQILIRLLRGERVATIADELYLSPRTVRNHLVAIFERFDVHSQAELLALLRAR